MIRSRRFCIFFVASMIMEGGSAQSRANEPKALSAADGNAADDAAEPSVESKNLSDILRASVPATINLFDVATNFAPLPQGEDALTANIRTMVNSMEYKELRALMKNVIFSRKTLLGTPLNTSRSQSYAAFKQAVIDELTHLRRAYVSVERGLNQPNETLRAQTFLDACKARPPRQIMSALEHQLQPCFRGEKSCVLDAEYALGERHTAALERAVDDIFDCVRDLIFFHKISDSVSNKNATSSEPDITKVGRQIVEKTFDWLTSKYEKVWAKEMPAKAKLLVKTFAEGDTIAPADFSALAHRVKKAMNLMGPRNYAYQVAVFSVGKHLSWHCFGDNNSRFAEMKAKNVDVLVTRHNFSDLARVKSAFQFAKSNEAALQTAAKALAAKKSNLTMVPVPSIHANENYPNTIHVLDQSPQIEATKTLSMASYAFVPFVLRKGESVSVAAAGGAQAPALPSPQAAAKPKRSTAPIGEGKNADDSPAHVLYSGKTAFAQAEIILVL